MKDKPMVEFAYDGFEQDMDRRRFLFRRIRKQTLPSLFLIDMDMSLLARNGVAVQDAPSFCIRMLSSALALGESALERYQQYEVCAEDFRELTAERAKRSAEFQGRRYKSRSRPRPLGPALPAGLFSEKRGHSS